MTKQSLQIQIAPDIEIARLHDNDVISKATVLGSQVCRCQVLTHFIPNRILAKRIRRRLRREEVIKR